MLFTVCGPIRPAGPDQRVGPPQGGAPPGRGPPNPLNPPTHAQEAQLGPRLQSLAETDPPLKAGAGFQCRRLLSLLKSQHLLRHRCVPSLTEHLRLLRVKLRGISKQGGWA